MKDLGIYTKMDINEYHSSEGLSSSGVSLILDCPARYHAEYMEDRDREESEKFEIGQSLHTYVLEQDDFHNRYYMMETEVDLRTKTGKETMEAEKLKAAGRKIIRKKDADFLLEMGKSVLKHPFWNKLVERNIEHSIWWEGGIFNTLLKARPDVYDDKIIVDIKTTDSIKMFKKSTYNYGYHRQAAMQIDALKSADNIERLHVFFVVEKRYPYLTSCFSLCEQSIQKGREEYLDAAITYRDCMNSGKWPGYEEKVQQISIPDWALIEKEEMI